MIVFLQGIIVILLLQLLFALWNASQLPKLGAMRGSMGDGECSCSGKEAARLSVLIPARDEAGNISDCLTSIMACSAAGIEVEILVLDDHSSDGTGRLAAAAGGSRVRVMQGRELPEGWLGKSFACAQLAEAAGGEWLLFLDADVRLRPNALQQAADAAKMQGRGLITGFPRQITGTWLERLVVPLMGFTIICHLPLPLVRGTHDPRFVAAHGGFMLIHRDSYFTSGGHKAIRSELVDDMALARAVKRAGEPVSLADIADDSNMRMYHYAAEVWRGYRKNIYAGVGRNPLLLLAMLAFYLLLYVLPFGIAIYSVLNGWSIEALYSLLAYFAGAAVKRISDASGRQPVWLCLLMPFSMLCLTAIGLSSWRGSYSGQGYEWKGRRYQ
ncbi:glycosyltransferase [Paenibacillus sp. HW567]|uniref:glycosyltransferase n=1 Tax=Paenibacillus sp. HW567 TaxID=1034769 RepID=UPI000379C90A|nr:glycosyltransferase family 2 protein [Paenibacillus sp. HW567]